MKYISMCLFLCSVLCNLVGLFKSHNYLLKDNGSETVLKWLGSALLLYLIADLSLALM